MKRTRSLLVAGPALLAAALACLPAEGSSGGFRQSMRLLRVAGAAYAQGSVGWYGDACVASVAGQVVEPLTGLPNGAFGASACGKPVDGGSSYYYYSCDSHCVGFGGTVGQESLALEVGTNTPYFYCDCGDWGLPCDISGAFEGEIAAVLTFDRPHEIGVAGIGFDGGSYGFDKYYGFGAICSNAYQPLVLIESFALAADGSLGPPVSGPWGGPQTYLALGESMPIAVAPLPDGGPPPVAFRISIVVPDAYGYGTRWSFKSASLSIERAWPAADVVPDGIVDPLDIAEILGSWGVDAAGRSAADINLDGVVDAVDLAAVVAAWGTKG